MRAYRERRLLQYKMIQFEIEDLGEHRVADFLERLSAMNMQFPRAIYYGWDVDEGIVALLRSLFRDTDIVRSGDKTGLTARMECEMDAEAPTRWFNESASIITMLAPEGLITLKLNEPPPDWEPPGNGEMSDDYRKRLESLRGAIDRRLA